MDKKTLFSYAITLSLLLLIIVFFDLSKVFSSVLEFSLPLFSLTVLFSALQFPARAVLWKQIVSPFAKISLSQSFHVTTVGFLANLVLPLRLGEIVRAFLLSKISGIPKSVALSTVIVSRIVEVLVLVGFFMIGVTAFPFIGNEIKTGVFFIGLLFLVFLSVFVFQKRFFSFFKKLGIDMIFPARAKAHAKNILSSAYSLSDPKSSAIIVFFSIITWLTQVVACFFVALGLGLSLGIGELLLIVSLSSLSVMIPSSPGFIGTFQAAFIAIFVALGLSAELGLSMSIILHAAAYISTVLLGVFSSTRLGISLTDVFSRAKKSSV